MCVRMTKYFFKDLNLLCKYSFDELKFFKGKIFPDRMNFCAWYVCHLLWALKWIFFKNLIEFCRDFAYVARDRTTRRHMCHVFRCDIPARTIANTLRDICKKIMIERSLQQNLAKPIDISEWILFIFNLQKFYSFGWLKI